MSSNTKRNEKCLIVLGYSLNSDCSMHPLLIARLKKALTAYQPGVPLLVSGGMPIEALTPDRCLKKTEAQAMKEYLLSKGVQGSDLLVEELSTTTLTNAYYSRLLHLDPLGIKKVVVVSNEFHMILVSYAFKTILGPDFDFQTISAPNDGMSPDELSRYEVRINQLASKCYPFIFEGIENGNMRTIHAVVNGLEANAAQKSKRLAFEKCLRESFSLGEEIPLRSVI